LAIDRANDELTKLVASCIRVGLAEISADVYRGKRYETEKKISTDNLMVGTISPKYQFDNSGKSPKTNENLAKEYGVAPATISRSGMLPK
jgi:hypothetical protein